MRECLEQAAGPATRREKRVRQPGGQLSAVLLGGPANYRLTFQSARAGYPEKVGTR